MLPVLAAALVAALAAADGARAAVGQAPARSGAAAAPGDSGARAGGAERRVDGRVTRPGREGLVGVPGAWVTLHRVGGDSAGPLDSMRTGPAGRYTFRYRPFGADDAIYFVSASYGGIAYFSPPLRRAAVSGEDADITVFDTTSATFPLTVQGRHMIVSAADAAGARTVIEVFELSNDSTHTLVGGAGDERPTWSAPVPAGAESFRVGEGDVPAGAVSLDAGRALVYAPFAPGLKQLSFSYKLPAKRFPLSVRLPDAASVLEVLVEDPTAAASGAQLAEVDPVSVDGRTFKRFLAQDAPANGVVTVAVAGVSRPDRTPLLIGVLALVGAGMLAALVRAATRRPRRPAAAVPAGAADVRESTDGLAREIALLDADFERQAAPSDDDRAAYEARRAALKARLTAALAGHGGRE